MWFQRFIILKMYITITNKSDFYKGTNFRYSELFSKSSDIGLSHPLSENLILAWQYIRSIYGPTKLNSTYRTFLGNTLIGGAKSSRHLTGNAIDGRPIKDEEFKQFLFDLENTNLPDLLLEKFGVKGIIIYNNFVHLDDLRSEVYYNFKKKSLIYNSEEDGIQNQKYILLFLFFIYYYFFRKKF
jgi:hypothetical protein